MDDFWDVENDRPSTMAEQWEGHEDVAAEVMAAEHASRDEPARSATLRRVWDTYTETMWIKGYPRQSWIIVTCPKVTLSEVAEMPGSIREIPVGHRDMATPQAFGAFFRKTVDSYLGQGWTLTEISVSE